MSGQRIYEIARKLGKENKDVITYLASIGITGKTHSSTIDEAAARRIVEHFKGAPPKPKLPKARLIKKVTTAEAEPEPVEEQAEEKPTAKLVKEGPEKEKVEEKPTAKPVEAQADEKKATEAPQKAKEAQKKEEAKPAAAPQKPKEEKKPKHEKKRKKGKQEEKREKDKQKAPVQPPRHVLASKHGGMTLGKMMMDKAAMAEIQKSETPGAEEGEEVKVPERFLKEMEAQKVEKLKTKPGMQKAFQAIRKIDSNRKGAAPQQVPSSFGKKRHRGSQPHGGGRIAQQYQDRAAAATTTAPRKKNIKISEGLSVKDFADAISMKTADLIKMFMGLGYMPNINQPVDIDAAMLIADNLGIKIEVSSLDEAAVVEEEHEDPALLVHRAPIVTIMGHVDHGKTSLLDAIRETKVIDTEAGGITQHIGAYKVTLKGKEIVFLDTPGHEAFTALRARGASVTDIVVLIVAADDGVKPQTLEAIDHAKAAGVPIMVAINKIDKPEAQPDKVRQELSSYNIMPEEWGGQSIFAEISAKKRIGIENLLELILLQAEVLELRANPDRMAAGVIIEAKLDKGRGPVATVLVQKGTLRLGDVFLSGVNTGKVKALYDDMGKKIEKAGPATPVEVLGFSNVPNAGDAFVGMDDEKQARQIALARLNKLRSAEVSKKNKLTLEELYSRIKEGEVKDLNIVLKGDVQGSVEAIKDSMEAIKHEEVKVKVIHSQVGGINESDVMLAAASNAIIIGFNVRPEIKAAQTAEREGVDIELYNIIYEAIDDVKKALEGMLKPTIKEKILGHAEVRNTFAVSRLGTIAGCMVVDGMMQRNSDGVRVIRDNIVVYQGRIASLKRFKDDAKEVQTGYECGIMIENFNDVKVGDIFENYVLEEIATKLEN